MLHRFGAVIAPVSRRMLEFIHFSILPLRSKPTTTIPITTYFTITTRPDPKICTPLRTEIREYVKRRKRSTVVREVAWFGLPPCLYFDPTEALRLCRAAEGDGMGGALETTTYLCI